MATHHLLRVLAMLSFLRETGLYLLYRKKVISAFKLIKNPLGRGTRFEGKNDELVIAR